MSDAIDRQVLARLRGCYNQDILNGICCTNTCDLRESCTVRRTKLIIPVLNITTDKRAMQTEILADESAGIPLIFIPITSIQEDGYLNEHTGMFTSEITST
jgi:hypothetical protein